MTINTGTMSLMVSVASILQSITLVFLFFLANKYRGIGIYAVGTVLSALGFMIFPSRLFLLDQASLLHLRFSGNLCITIAQVMYTIAIGKFLSRKVNYFLFIIFVLIFCIIQFYFIYINNNYVIRNISVILPTIIFHLFAVHYLLTNKDKSLFASSIFICITFILHIISLISRLIILPFTNTTSLMQSNTINIITLWSIFIFDYLRNSGFIMMVSQRLYKDLRTLATTDFLTKALNRRAIEKYLHHEVGRFERHKTPFSLILIDIDKFKLINDNYGHTSGDIVLQHLVITIEKSLRSQDLLSRWGGEEFLILLPNTDIEEASVIGERLRATIESNPSTDQRIYYTISLGVATFEEAYINSLSLFFSTLDQALYQAKANGRNQVVIVPKIG